MFPAYKIASRALLLHDQESVRFHVTADDYFGTLATILSLWQQRDEWPQKEYREIFDDLEDLQNHYRIIKKK